jgi:predicted transcriptional regulator
MNTIEVQVLRAQLAIETNLISQEDLARRAGLRGSTLTGMLSPTWNPTRNTLSRIVDVLDRIDEETKKAKTPLKASKKSR